MKGKSNARADTPSRISVDELKNGDNNQGRVMTRAMSKRQNNDKIKISQSSNDEDIQLKI